MADKRGMWSKRIVAWERSGLTRAAFCEARRLNVHTFDYWRRALRTGSAQALVPVAVRSAPKAAAAVAAPIDVLLSNGLRLQVRSGSDLAMLRSVIEVLRGC